MEIYVYSDSIPLFALCLNHLIFITRKISILSIWFVLSFFLQGILSYFLILKITKDKYLFFFFSLFFMLFPPALYRIDWHPALFGHWTLILSIYLIFEKDKTNDFHWNLLILLTSLIHFYFTIINLIIFNLIKIYNFLSSKISFNKYLLSISTCHISFLIFVMYLVGYFEVRIVDTFALGFGI